MAGTTTAMCNSFKQEILVGTHNFTASTGDTFKAALIKVSPTGTYDKTSTNYSNVTGNSDEVASGGGYTTGGNTLVSVTPALSGDTACCDFNDSSWTSATFSTTACMIYNSSKANRATSVYDFGGSQTVSAGTLTLQWPVPDASNAVIRIG